MTVVVDSNLVLSLAVPLPYSQQAIHLVKEWKESGETMNAPVLLEYEIVSALRKLTYLGNIGVEEAFAVLDNLLALGLHRHNPTPERHKRALEWAKFLGQSKAYDSQYLALAESLHSDLWTADKRLVRDARDVGAGWVHWIGGLNVTEDS